MRKWGTFPVPVHVPLNRVQEHCGRRTKGQRLSDTPTPGPTRSFIHNYNTEMSRSHGGQEVGEAGRTEEKKEPSSTSRVRGATGV